MVIPIIYGMASIVTSGQHFLIAIGNMGTPTTIDNVMYIGTTAMTTDIRLILNKNGHHQDSRNTVGHKSKYIKRPHTTIRKVESGSECDSECLAASDFKEHLEEEAVPTPVSPKY